MSLSCKNCNLNSSITVNISAAKCIINMLDLLLWMETYCLSCEKKLWIKLLTGLSMGMKNLDFP